MMGKRQEACHPHSWTAPGLISGFYARGRSQKMNCISLLDSRIQTLSLLLGFLQVPLKCMHIMKVHSPFKPPTARASQRRFGFLTPSALPSAAPLCGVYLKDAPKTESTDVEEMFKTTARLAGHQYLV